MSQFSQRVGLVHELGQLGATEEFSNSGHHRAYVNQALGGRRFRVHQSHFLFDHPLHSQQAHAHLVLHQFAYGPYTAVAQMVDVVGFSVALIDPDNVADDRHYVIHGQRHQFRVVCLAQTPVKLVPAYPAQVVAAGDEE